MATYLENIKPLSVLTPNYSLSSTCNHLFMKNLISKIEGLDHLKNLEYLALNNNNISVLENIKGLNKLEGLNLSNN